MQRQYSTIRFAEMQFDSWRIAQLVEQMVRSHRVAGSIPAIPTDFLFFFKTPLPIC